MRVVAPFHEGFACGVAGLAVEAFALFGCAYPEESVGADVEVCAATTEVERGHWVIESEAQYLAFVWLDGDVCAEPFLGVVGAPGGLTLLLRRRRRVCRLRGLRRKRGRHLSAGRRLCPDEFARRCARRRGLGRGCIRSR